MAAVAAANANVAEAAEKENAVVVKRGAVVVHYPKSVVVAAVRGSVGPRVNPCVDPKGNVVVVRDVRSPYVCVPPNVRRGAAGKFAEHFYTLSS